MPKMQVDKGEFSNVVTGLTNYVKAANEQLAKKSEADKQLEKVASSIARKMAKLDLIDESSVEDVTAEITDNGISKVSDAVDFIVSELGRKRESKQDYSLGKASSVADDNETPQSADDYFVRALGF